MANKKSMIIISTATRLLNNINIVKKMILSGSDVIRFNFSYDTVEQKIKNIQHSQEIIEELNAHIKILVDLPGPKIRLGGFPGQDLHVREGENIILKSAAFTDNPNDFLPIQTKEIGNLFFPEQTIIIDEGEIAIKIIEIIDQDTVRCLILNSGNIFSYKGLNFPQQNLDPLPIIQNIHQKIIDKLKEIRINYIACPLVNNEEIAKNYKKIIDDTRWKYTKPKIVFKLETQEAVENIKDIIKYCDLLILERGNLGLNVNFEKVGTIQKKVIKICHEAKKAVIVSTQILESTINNFIPQRSDILDLTNIVLDGAYGIMLCHETGVSSRPAYAISIAKKIIHEAEKYKKSIN